MNHRQYIDVVNYIGTQFPSLVLAKTKVKDEPGLRPFHGSNVPILEQALTPLPSAVTSTDLPETEILVFDNVDFFGPNGMTNITPIGAVQKMVKLTTRLTWEGSLNGFDRCSTLEHPEESVSLDHFKNPEQVRRFLKNGIPIKLSEILKTVPTDVLFGKNEIHVVNMAKDYVRELNVGQVMGRDSKPLTKCTCNQSFDRDTLDFDCIYIHGFSFDAVESTFPVPCGIKANCINFGDDGEGELFYRNLLYINQKQEKENNQKAPPPRPHTVAGFEKESNEDQMIIDEDSTPSSTNAKLVKEEKPNITTEPPREKDPEMTVRCVGPYHDFYWVSTFGGLNLSKEFGHYGSPLFTGTTRIPKSLLATNANQREKQFFTENDFLFVPREHHLFAYFERLYQLQSNDNVDFSERKTALHGKSNLRNLYYQFIKLPVLTSMASALKDEFITKKTNTKEDENTSSSSSSNSQIGKDEEQDLSNRFSHVMDLMVADEGVRRSPGHGLIVDTKSLTTIATWFLDDFKIKNWFQYPPSLENVELLLFRTNTKDQQWLVESDQRKFTIDELNKVYSFTMTLSITFSIFPKKLTCRKDFVSTRNFAFSPPIKQ